MEDLTPAPVTAAARSQRDSAEPLEGEEIVKELGLSMVDEGNA